VLLAPNGVLDTDEHPPGAEERTDELRRLAAALADEKISFSMAS
jgi:hypothetical protein